MNIETMKQYYQKNLWSLERLLTLLKAGKITQEEFDEITITRE